MMSDAPHERSVSRGPYAAVNDRGEPVGEFERVVTSWPVPTSPARPGNSVPGWLDSRTGWCSRPGPDLAWSTLSAHHPRAALAELDATARPASAAVLADLDLLNDLPLHDPVVRLSG